MCKAGNCSRDFLAGTTTLAGSGAALYALACCAIFVTVRDMNQRHNNNINIYLNRSLGLTFMLSNEDCVREANDDNRLGKGTLTKARDKSGEDTAARVLKDSMGHLEDWLGVRGIEEEESSYS